MANGIVANRMWPILTLLVMRSAFCLARFIQNIPKDFSSYDICSSTQYGVRRIFLDEGETGSIVGRKITYNDIQFQQKPYFFTAPPMVYVDMNRNDVRICSIELITCPLCSLQIQTKMLNISSCENGIKCSDCDHLSFKETSYTNPFMICGSNKPMIQYHSVAKSVTINFAFSRSYEFAFLLQYTSVNNGRVISGKIGTNGLVQSPHFPNLYPRDYNNEIQLQIVDNKTGIIQLIFEDFQLAPLSVIEIFDAKGSRVQQLNGNSFRPPVIIGEGNELTLRFYANGGRAPGFRARYSFLNEPKETLEVPNIDCGGSVEDNGGVITMVNMSNPNLAKLYDCIWLIKPISNYQQKPHLLVQIIQLSKQEYGTSIEIRQGLTSQGNLLDLLGNDRFPTSDYISPVDTGFYIRLRGRLSHKFKMAITYSAFSYTECYAMRDFVCSNHRCISAQLRCDGFDHCGDNSDEQIACNKVISPEDPKWWMTHTPNYYFPKSDISELGTSSIVVFASLIGVFIFLASFFIILCHISSNSPGIRDRLAHMDFLRDQSSTPPTPETPPSYEAPPDYTEIVKLNDEPKENTEILINIPPDTPAKTLAETNDLSDGYLSANEHSNPSSAFSTPSKRSRSRSRSRRSKKANNPTPIHAKNPLLIDDTIPNSPPPSYEVSVQVIVPQISETSPTSPARATSATTDALAILDAFNDHECVIHEDECQRYSYISQLDSQIKSETSSVRNFMQIINDCGCPGACSCRIIDSVKTAVAQYETVKNFATKDVTNLRGKLLCDFVRNEDGVGGVGVFESVDCDNSGLDPPPTTTTTTTPILGERINFADQFANFGDILVHHQDTDLQGERDQVVNNNFAHCQVKDDLEPFGNDDLNPNDSHARENVGNVADSLTGVGRKSGNDQLVRCLSADPISRPFIAMQMTKFARSLDI